MCLFHAANRVIERESATISIRRIRIASMIAKHAIESEGTRWQTRTKLEFGNNQSKKNQSKMKGQPEKRRECIEKARHSDAAKGEEHIPLYQNAWIDYHVEFERKTGWISKISNTRVHVAVPMHWYERRTSLCFTSSFGSHVDEQFWMKKKQ